MIKLKKEIGQRLKKCRVECGLTQQNLSEKIGLQTKSYANIEAGRTLFSVETLISLANTLNISADYILFGYASGNFPLNSIIDSMPPNDLERIETIIRIYKEAIDGK